MYFSDASYQQNQAQRGKSFMTQNVLPFQYEEERGDTGMSSLTGLAGYLDLSHTIGFWKSSEKYLQN